MLVLPRRVRKDTRIAPTGLEPPAVTRNREKKPLIIPNNSSIKPGSVPDPKFFLFIFFG